MDDEKSDSKLEEARQLENHGNALHGAAQGQEYQADNHDAAVQAMV